MLNVATAGAGKVCLFGAKTLIPTGHGMATFQFAPLVQPTSPVVAIVRKRARCDSDPQGRPEKMYKAYEDTNDADTEMEGSMSASSSASSACALSVSEIDVNSQRSWKRDEEFYIEDGSCVFLVQDILFNVSY